MNPIRRRLIAGTACAAAVTSLPALVRAQRTDPLHVYVGFPPGGASDVVARVLAEELRTLLKRPLIVENRPGAGGMVATRLLKNAPADGSVVMLTIDHTHVIVPLTMKDPGYNPATDFTSLAGVASYYNVMAVNGGLGISTLAEYGDWVKAGDNRAHFGVPAAGSIPQFAGLLVGQALGVPLSPVPYAGGAPLLSDLFGNHVPAAVLSLTETIDHHRAGKLRILAVSGQTRAQRDPSIPTFAESGVPGIDKNPWTGFFGPRGLPSDFVVSFSEAMAEALKKPALAERLNGLGNVVDYASPEALDAWVADATRHWGPIILASGYEKQ